MNECKCFDEDHYSEGIPDKVFLEHFESCECECSECECWCGKCKYCKYIILKRSNEILLQEINDMIKKNKNKL